MKALVAGLTAAVICLAGAVGYLAWDRIEGEDRSPGLLAEEITPTADVPRYTQEEVVAKIVNYEFDMERGGEIERLTVSHSLFYTLCGGIAGDVAMTVPWMEASEYLDELQKGARPCKHTESATYEGAGRWTVTIDFEATLPLLARFSFREDTGEIIPLNGEARALMGY